MTKRFNLWDVLTRKTDRDWPIALALTFALGIAGLFCVAILRISGPTIVAAPGWPIVDKRWLVALYGLGVGLVYLPLIAKEIANLLTHSELPGTTASAARSHTSRLWAIHCAALPRAILGLRFQVGYRPILDTLDRPEV